MSYSFRIAKKKKKDVLPFIFDSWMDGCIISRFRLCWGRGGRNFPFYSRRKHDGSGLQ